jgi:hypothetical protein
MIDKFSGMKAELSELAAVLNKFNSEAVQLRLLDIVFGKGQQVEDEAAAGKKTSSGASRQRGAKLKKTVAAVGEKRKKASVGTGANAALSQLLLGDFFNKPRTINDVIEHCKHNLARTFKANEFSSKLGRMVRGSELTRKKNADNQYEYKKA